MLGHREAVNSSILPTSAAAPLGFNSAATGSEVGDFFEYEIDRSVSVCRGQSVLIPIPQTRMEAELVSI